MCTVSWLIGARGYQLFDNRDESRRRLPAAPPRRHVQGGVRFLAPTDADAGGTWIGVNEHGVALTLLNAWDLVLQPPPEGFRSRGLLVREHLDASSASEAEERLRAAPLERYQGFRMVLLEPEREGPVVLVWDGEQLAREEPLMPLASSALGPAEAHRERRAALARLRAEGLAGEELLERLHASHWPERGPWSVCMHRDDASTVSASRVIVEDGRVRFRYAPGPPCRTALGPGIDLRRVRA